MLLLRRWVARVLFRTFGARGFNRLSAVMHAAKGGLDAPAAGTTDVVASFHILSYNSGALHNTYWMGRPIQKSPLDCWVYQELIHELRPDLIVETGTYLGGSALLFGQLCDLVGSGAVLTIDVQPRTVVTHPRVRQLIGDTTDPAILGQVAAAARSARTVMVVLDSDHGAAHVSRELAAYAPFVTVGSYLVVEDTNVNGHPVNLAHGPGPMEALRQFLPAHPEFLSDRGREKFLLSYFPEGWLRRVR